MLEEGRERRRSREKVEWRAFLQYVFSFLQSFSIYSRPFPAAMTHLLLSSSIADLPHRRHYSLRHPPHFSPFPTDPPILNPPHLPHSDLCHSSRQRLRDRRREARAREEEQADEGGPERAFLRGRGVKSLVVVYLACSLSRLYPVNSCATSLCVTCPISVRNGERLLLLQQHRPKVVLTPRCSRCAATRRSRSRRRRT
jgi:hypothetical protein